MLLIVPQTTLVRWHLSRAWLPVRTERGWAWPGTWVWRRRVRLHFHGGATRDEWEYLSGQCEPRDG